MDFESYSINGDKCIRNIIIPSEDFNLVINDMKNLQNFMVENEIELAITEQIVGLNWVHLTYPENVDAILQNGFRDINELDYAGNMGYGLYCCDLDDKKSLDALLCFALDLAEGDEELAVFKGTYYGKFLRCFYAKDEGFKYNEGFYLLKNLKRL